MESKLQHDKKMAELRPVDCNKAWFQAARGTLKRLNWRGGRALNLCCGNNEFSFILKNEFHAAVSAADVVPASVERAAADGFDAFVIDMDDPDSRQELQKAYQEKFDLIVSTAAIEHIFDTNGFFSFCHDVLRLGGWLLLTTPNMSFIGNRIYSELQGGIPLGANNHHITFWTYKNLYAYFRSYGFTDIRDESRYFPERYTTARVRHLLGNGLKAAFEKIYDLIGKLDQTHLKPFVANELVVVGRKTEEKTFHFPFTLLNMKAMPELEKRELVRRCADMNRKGILKRHPGCYQRFLELRAMYDK